MSHKTPRQALVAAAVTAALALGPGIGVAFATPGGQPPTSQPTTSQNPGDDHAQPGDHSGNPVTPDNHPSGNNPPPSGDNAQHPGGQQGSTTTPSQPADDDHGGTSPTSQGHPDGNQHPGDDHPTTTPPPTTTHQPPPTTTGDGHHGDKDHPQPQPGGDGHDSHPPTNHHDDTTTIGGDTNVTVVIAPNVNIILGGNQVINNTTVVQVTNIQGNNVQVVEGNQTYNYKEVTIYSKATHRFFTGYYDGTGNFVCTGYYPETVTTVAEAQTAQATNQVVKNPPPAAAVTGHDPASATSINYPVVGGAIMLALLAVLAGVLLARARRRG